MRSPSPPKSKRLRRGTARAAFLLVAWAGALSCVGADRDHVEVSEQSCVSCHRPEYLRAEQPVHGGVFPETCGDCHDEDSWKPAHGFDHEDFALEGGHAGVVCMSCHTQGFEPGQTPRDCVGCHRDDYDKSSFPGHRDFATTCMDCHTTTAWKPAPGFNHDFFALEGAHADTTCLSCHTQGFEPGQTPRDCVGCHRDDYDKSSFPGHRDFATTCLDCHTTTAWKPAPGFNHDFFALEGAHADTTCLSCHTQGFQPGQTPRECVGCHLDDYRTSPFPGHQDFATTCMDCHTTTAWKPATGGHPESKFPTNDKHEYACNDCHNSQLGANGKGNADCVGCHEGEHSRSKMDEKHHEVNDYPAGSAPPNFCLDCHPKGQKED